MIVIFLGDVRKGFENLFHKQDSPSVIGTSQESFDLKDILDARYPYGYVTFRYTKGDFISTPVLASSVMRITANWRDTKFIISNDSIEVTIPEITMSKKSGQNYIGTMRATIGTSIVKLPLVRGQAIYASSFFISNEKNIHFEFIDSRYSQDTLFVLGFKEPDSDSPYIPHSSELRNFHLELKPKGN